MIVWVSQINAVTKVIRELARRQRITEAVKIFEQAVNYQFITLLDFDFQPSEFLAHFEFPKSVQRNLDIGNFLRLRKIRMGVPIKLSWGRHVWALPVRWEFDWRAGIKARRLKSFWTIRPATRRSLGFFESRRSTPASARLFQSLRRAATIFGCFGYFGADGFAAAAQTAKTRFRFLWLCFWSLLFPPRPTPLLARIYRKVRLFFLKFKFINYI